MIRFGSDCTGLDAPFIALKRVLTGVEIKHVFASDIDKYAKQMFLANHKTCKFYDDACIPGENKPPVDFYFAGFPCQTFSIAGKRSGFNDVRGRGTVFFYCADYIRKRRPAVFVLENVKGLLSHNKGKTMKTIMHILRSIPGYKVSYSVLSPDKHANWPQHRDRVFLTGQLYGSFDFPGTIPLTVKGSSLLDLSLPPHSISASEQKNLDYKCAKYLAKGIDIMKDYYFIDIGTSPHFGSALYEKSPAMKASRSNYFVTKLHRKINSDEIRQFQGFPEMKVVVSDSQYRKQLGNSICIPVLVVLFRKIFVST